MSSTRREFLVSSAAFVASGSVLGAHGSDRRVSGSSASDWYMPAEEGPHDSTWLCWPSAREIWGSMLPDAQANIASIARAINEYEPVTVLARPSARRAARRLLGSQIALEPAPVDDLWARDTLPAFLIDAKQKRKLAAGVLRFNGWGGKQLHTGDDRLAAIVAGMLVVPTIEAHLTGEGGGFDGDGAGTVLAARSSWVNKNRNPSLSEKQIGERLASLLGAERVLWVDGLAGHDITDGHIDTLARFIDPKTVLLENTAPDDASIWSGVARQTRRQVKSFRTLNGAPYELVTLQQPAKLPSNSDTFLASYVNYYTCNGAVIAPKFGDRQADDRARELLAHVYPNREIVQLRIDTVAEGGGGIHCATQQQPAV